MRVPPTLLLILPQREVQDSGVKLQQRARPRFCGFFPQKLAGRGRSPGPPSAKPAGERGSRAGSGLLGVLDGRGWHTGCAGDVLELRGAGPRHAPWGQGTEEPSSGRGEGRRDNFGQKQPTILVRQLLTKGGRETKFTSGGLSFLVFAARFPAPGTCQPGRGRAGSGSLHRGNPSGNLFALWKCLEENGSAPEVTLGRWEPWLCVSRRDRVGTRSPLGREEGVLRTSLPPAAPPPGPCRRQSSHSGWWWPGARRACCRPRPRLVLPSRALGGCWEGGERG